jgi:transposase
VAPSPRIDIPCVADDLCAEIAPLLPPLVPQPKGGRPFADDRAELCAILFVRWTGAPWRAIPRGPGSASPATAWRRLRDWQAAGVWDTVHRGVRDRMGTADAVAWERVCVDSASIPAKRGELASAPTRPIAPNQG